LLWLCWAGAWRAVVGGACGFSRPWLDMLDAYLDACRRVLCIATAAQRSVLANHQAAGLPVRLQEPDSPPGLLGARAADALHHPPAHDVEHREVSMLAAAGWLLAVARRLRFCSSPGSADASSSVLQRQRQRHPIAASRVAMMNQSTRSKSQHARNYPRPFSPSRGACACATWCHLASLVQRITQFYATTKSPDSASALAPRLTILGNVLDLHCLPCAESPTKTMPQNDRVSE